MMPSRARLRLQAWFALAILVLGMLAPGLSVALSHARGDFALQAEICSAARRGGDGTAPVDNPALDMLTLGHCAMCHAHAADTLAPPPAPDAAALTLRGDLAFAMPERFFSAPVTAHCWRAAPARAPPASA